MQCDSEFYSKEWVYGIIIIMRKIKIIIGRLLYSLIGRHLPVAHFIIRPIGIFSKKIRAFCGICILKKCGKNVNIYPKASFSSSVELGDNSDIGLAARINGKCIIGKDVIMGPEVVVYTTNHRTDRIDIPIKYQGNTDERPVVIGDGCWICSRAIILPGVTIGEGSVVAAGSIVTKDVPPFSIVAGNPARIVKKRN